MNDPLQALFQTAESATRFPPTSRYHGVPAATYRTASGRTVAYLRRRLIPPPERFALMVEHAVAEGDRLDNLATRYLGDPHLYWRICDANAALRPDALTEDTGRQIRITLPEGIPGNDEDAGR